MNCHEAKDLMHAYMDGDLAVAENARLKAHLNRCPGCTQWFEQAERTEAYVRSMPDRSASGDLTAKVMAALPRQPRRSRWMNRARRYPAAAAAFVFVMIMAFGMAGMAGSEEQLVVKGAFTDQVIIEGDRVIVPEGTTIHGDLTVENGSIVLRGDVEGNVLVIDGSLQLASTAHISGKVTQIDQLLDRFWYKINEWFEAVTPEPG